MSRRLETWQINVSGWEGFQDEVFITRKHTHSFAPLWGIHTNPKQVICTGGKKLTVNCLLCHLCCGEFTTNNKAVSEWAVTGGKFASSRFTANLADETHQLTYRTILYKQATSLKKLSLPSYWLHSSKEQSSKTIAGIWRAEKWTNYKWRWAQSCTKMASNM